jgi:hypothetical protein
MTLRKLGRQLARSSSSSRSASCAGAISVSQACALISCSSTSSSNGWCSTIVPPDNSQTTSEVARPANDIGENADSMVEPCGTSLSSETARPPAIRPRWARGTGRKPSEVRSNEISAALRPSWITARVVVDSLKIALSSEAMPSGKSVPKPQTWRIENASAAAFMARSA